MGWVKRLPAIYDLVKKTIEKANGRQSKFYNRGRVEKTYKIGDIVKRKKFVLPSKAKNIMQNQQENLLVLAKL